jgi:hypothetical protein
MTTDNDFHDSYLSSGWSASADSANVVEGWEVEKV